MKKETLIYTRNFQFLIGYMLSIGRITLGGFKTALLITNKCILDEHKIPKTTPMCLYTFIVHLFKLSYMLIYTFINNRNDKLMVHGAAVVTIASAAAVVALNKNM